VLFEEEMGMEAEMWYWLDGAAGLRGSRFDCGVGRWTDGLVDLNKVDV